MPIDFSPYSAVFLDLDGTVYHETNVLPGAVELVNRLKESNIKFACLTNSGASPLHVMETLETMGIDIDPDNIYTAAAAACDYVMEHFASATHKPRIFNLATQSCHEMLEGSVDWVGAMDEPCDAVIIAGPLNKYANFERQRIALELARRGARIIGLCADRVYPSPRGIEFGAGSLTWMIAYGANVEPIFCGKPEEVFFRELCTRLDVRTDACLLIGDNLESDIMGAKRVGMRTILTLTGVARRSDLESLAAECQPDLVIEKLTELL